MFPMSEALLNLLFSTIRTRLIKCHRLKHIFLSTDRIWKVVAVKIALAVTSIPTSFAVGITQPKEQTAPGLFG